MNASLDDPIRIFLVDSYILMRTGIRLIIESHPEMKVVGEAGNSDEAFELIDSSQPNIMLLSLDSEGIIGLELIQKLLSDTINLRIILLAQGNEAPTILSAVKAGVLGIVLKNQAQEVLIKAIEKVHAGEIWIERSMITDLLSGFVHNKQAIAQDPETRRIGLLSAREIKVIQLLGKGLRNKQIAEQLCLSETTVRHYLTSIYNKLDVKDRLELLVYANRHILD